MVHIRSVDLDTGDYTSSSSSDSDSFQEEEHLHRRYRTHTRPHDKRRDFLNVPGASTSRSYSRTRTSRKHVNASQNNSGPRIRAASVGGSRRHHRVDPTVYIGINNEQHEIPAAPPAPPPPPRDRSRRARSLSRRREAQELWDELAAEMMGLGDTRSDNIRKKMEREREERERIEREQKLKDRERELEAQLRLSQLKLQELTEARLWGEFDKEEELYRRRRKQLDKLLRDREREQEALERERERVKELEREREKEREKERQKKEIEREIERELARERRGRYRSPSRSSSSSHGGGSRRRHHRSGGATSGGDDVWTRQEIENELAHEQLRQIRQEEANKRHVEDALRMRRLQAMEEEEERSKRERKIRDKIEAERAKAEAEEKERLEELARLRAEAIEAYKREEAEKELKRREEEERAEREFEDRLRQKLVAAGKTEDEIRCFLQPKKDKDCQDMKMIMPPPREVQDIQPVMRAHRRFISPAAIEHFNLPWEWDPYDADYIIIPTWVDEDTQDRLFEYSRKIRDQQPMLPAPPPAVMTAAPEFVEMKCNDKKKDKIWMVRKKGKSGGQKVVVLEK